MMLKDPIINYENLEDQLISDFLQKIETLSNEQKDKIYLISPFLPEQLGKFNLAIDLNRMDFLDIRKKNEFLTEIENHFDQEKVNVYDLFAIEKSRSKVAIKYSLEALNSKLSLTEIVADKSISLQWSERLEENKKKTVTAQETVNFDSSQTQEQGMEAEVVKSLNNSFPDLSEEDCKRIVEATQKVDPEIKRKMIDSVWQKNKNPKTTIVLSSSKKIDDKTQTNEIG